MARLDRLAPVKEVAQVAAVIGREFSHELLAAVSPLDSEHLIQALDQPVSAELVFRHGQGPEASYVFKHALVQDAAYESTLKSRRQQLHGRIARTLETQFAALAETSPELPAMHFDRAGLIDEAVIWYMRAGDRAQARSANKEAVSHFERALDLLDRTRAQDMRAGLELEIRAHLGALFTTLEGWTSARALEHDRRGHELGDLSGHEEAWMIASGNLASNLSWTGNLPEARKLGEELVNIAVARANRVHEMHARNAYGQALMYSGRFRDALDQWQALLKLYDRDGDAGCASRYGFDFGAAALGTSAYMTWELGYPDQALVQANEAIDLARRNGHSFTLAFALTYQGADISYFMRNDERMLRFAREGEEIATKGGFAYLALTCSFHYGFCLVRLDRVEEGVHRMFTALERMKQLGALKRRTPRLIAQLADALRNRGRADEGLQTLSASPDRLPGGTRVRYSEIYRIEGDLQLHKSQPDPVAAEACYQEAIAVAMEDGARTRQLRASISLARLWLTQGKAEQAYLLLHPLYDSFTEGFATLDLTDAKQVLDEAAPMSRSAA